MNQIIAGKQGQTPAAAGPWPDNAVTLRLDAEGVIDECEGEIERLFGYRAGELIGSHVSRLITYLGEVRLVRDGQLEPRLAYLSRCGFGFEAVHRGGRRFAADLYFSSPGNEWAGGMNLIVRRKDNLTRATVRPFPERAPDPQAYDSGRERSRADSRDEPNRRIDQGCIATASGTAAQR